MNIDSIKNGIVIDHIKAGKSLEIYHLLNLDKVDCSVAIIKNVNSRKMGKKDIIKIDSDIEIDLDTLGYIDPFITIDIIKDGKLVEKKHVELPNRIVYIVKAVQNINSNKKAYHQEPVQQNASVLLLLDD